MAVRGSHSRLPHFRSWSVVVGTAALLWLAACLPPASAGLNITLCLPLTTFERDARGEPLKLRWEDAAKEAASAMVAVRDVNAADCTVVGEGCESKLTVRGERITVSPVVYDMSSWAPTAAPPVVIDCTDEAGGHAMAGFLTSGQASGAALLSNVYGIPIVSHSATSGKLNDKALYPYFARTIYSDETKAVQWAKLAAHLHWTEVVVMHISDDFGQGFAEAFAQSIREVQEGVSLEFISLGAVITNDTARSGLEQLSGVNAKVLILFAFPEDVVKVFRVAQETGYDLRKYVLLLGANGATSVIAEVGDDEPEVMDMLHGCLTLSQWIEEEDQTEAFDERLGQLFSADDFAALLRNNRGESDPRLLPGFQELVTDVPPGRTMHNNLYDAVWATAFAFAHAANSAATPSDDGPSDDGGASQVPSGASVYQSLVTPGVVAFSGASGRVEFEEGGDRKVSSATLQLENMVRSGSTGEPVTVVSVGMLSLEAVTLYEDQPIQWPDGSVYPENPGRTSDPPQLLSSGSKGSSMNWVILACALAAVVVLVLASLAMVRKNRALVKRLDFVSNEAQKGLDLESPLAKMMDFLLRYRRKNWQLSLGSWVLSLGHEVPSTLVAADLQDLLAVQSHKLTTPDFRQQMKKNGDYNNTIIRFLQENATHDNDWDETASSIDTAGSGPSVYDITALNGCYDDATVAATRAPIDWSTKPTVPSIGPIPEEVSLAPGDVVVPSHIASSVTRDYFFDVVTEGSLLRSSCASPLATVVRAAVTSLSLDSSVLSSPASVEALVNFALHIEQGYLDDGYHCKLHATDVTNRFVSMLVTSGITARASSSGMQEQRDAGYHNSYDDAQLMMSAAIAGAVHDYRHTQVNNALLVSEGSPLALQFNDHAVGEMYSLREALGLIEAVPEVNFLDGMSAEEKLHIRRNIIQLVLATDMSEHFDKVSMFQMLVVQSRELEPLRGRQKWCRMSSKQKLLTLQMALKVSDIGHCCIPLEQHVPWVRRLQNEFFRQGDLERSLGRRVISPLMDRRKPGPCSGASQVGFFDVIVLPMMEAWVAAFPEHRPMLQQAKDNLAYWKEQAEIEKGGKRHIRAEIPAAEDGVGEVKALRLDAWAPPATADDCAA